MYEIHHSVDEDARFRTTARALGYGGLVPFALGALGAWGLLGLDAVGQAALGQWIALYGAVILSFMGGARWGAAVRDVAPGRLVPAILPALVGWAALIPPGITGGALTPVGQALVLITAFLFLLIAELVARDWDHWYAALRFRLTVGVVGLLLVMALGLRAAGM